MNDDGHDKPGAGNTSAPTFKDDPGPWDVVSSSYVSCKEWFTVRLERVRLPTGAEIPEYWVTEYRPWVNVVAVTTDDKLVLIRQYRHGLGAVHFEIPAGTTDAGEHDLEAAARRELGEETGYGGGTWSLLATLSANPALQNNLTYTFLAEGVTRLDSGPRPESSEDLRIHLVPVRDVAPLIDGGGFIQALHVAPLLRYLMRRHEKVG
ncbi:MAG: NUDIX hydrolase [Deltaproteobacteria bacterium]|nr:NUDIX hydrolase [Deltaproteobacteria bacterium]